MPATVGIRMTAVDGGSGEVENTAVLTAHLTLGGKTIDVPMRWRGQGGFPAQRAERGTCREELPPGPRSTLQIGGGEPDRGPLGLGELARLDFPDWLFDPDPGPRRG